MITHGRNILTYSIFAATLLIPLVLCCIGLTASLGRPDSSATSAACGRIPLGLLLTVVSHVFALGVCCVMAAVAGVHCRADSRRLADPGDDAADCACVTQIVELCTRIGGAVAVLVVAGLLYLAALVCLTAFYSRSHATCGGTVNTMSACTMCYEWVYLAMSAVGACTLFCISAHRREARRADVHSQSQT
ncbi:MAG: hypothetical protein WC732_09915 [Candidatus Omnitrophota bacterium]